MMFWVWNCWAQCTLEYMDVTVLLFGPASTAAGTDRVTVCLESDHTVGSLRDALAAQYPALEVVLTWGRIAVNQKYAPSITVIKADDEVALVALVSGG